MNQVVIDIDAEAGDFAEDKDAARRLREETLLPALRAGDEVVLDFSGSPASTQSFLHALFSSVIRTEGPDVLDRIVFRGASEIVRSLIRIVSEYSQEGLEQSEDDPEGT